MPSMHWCACKVNLSGQGFYIYHYNQHEPVSWPEVQVITALHGDNVFDVTPVSVGETTARQEKERLVAKYGADVCERVFPGRIFRMEMMMPGEATDQPSSDDYGAIIDHTPEEPVGQEPPTSSPVFKPGKNRPNVTGL
jgi:hypothetical protein